MDDSYWITVLYCKSRGICTNQCDLCVTTQRLKAIHAALEDIFLCSWHQKYSVPGREQNTKSSFKTYMTKSVENITDKKVS